MKWVGNVLTWLGSLDERIRVQRAVIEVLREDAERARNEASIEPPEPRVHAAPRADSNAPSVSR